MIGLFNTKTIVIAIAVLAIGSTYRSMNHESFESKQMTNNSPGVSDKSSIRNRLLSSDASPSVNPFAVQDSNYIQFTPDHANNSAAVKNVPVEANSFLKVVPGSVAIKEKLYADNPSLYGALQGEQLYDTAGAGSAQSFESTEKELLYANSRRDYVETYGDSANAVPVHELLPPTVSEQEYLYASNPDWYRQRYVDSAFDYADLYAVPASLTELEQDYANNPGLYTDDDGVPIDSLADFEAVDN